MRKLILFLVIIIFLVGCNGAQKKKQEILSELQITACKKAHEAGTCDTRLIEVGIVKKEDCCNALGKCC